MHAELAHLPHVHLVEPLTYPDFVRLLQLSHFMLSDSGGVQEEAPDGTEAVAATLRKDDEVVHKDIHCGQGLEVLEEGGQRAGQRQIPRQGRRAIAGGSQRWGQSQGTEGQAPCGGDRRWRLVVADGT